MDHLKTEVLELVQALGSISSDDLKNKIEKNGNQINESVLNKILFHLEIQGLITVRWSGKKKRRIELSNLTTKQTNTL